jgi:PPOX class probable F420-dependent enzyme
MTQSSISTPGLLASLPPSGVALLTTFRRNGNGVGTPVGIHILDDKIYFTTWSTTGKIKRLAATPRVTLAPSTRAGKATGPAIAGTARRLDEVEAAQVIPRLGSPLRRWIWLQIYRFVYRAKPVLFEVTPLAEQ